MLPVVAGAFYVFDHYTIRRTLCLCDSDETPRLLVRQLSLVNKLDFLCSIDFAIQVSPNTLG